MINLEEIAEFIGEDMETVCIYFKILSNSSVYLNDISNDIEHNEIMGHIEKLSNLYLISDFTDRNYKSVYFPIDPQFSFSSLLLREIWNSDEKLHTIDDLLHRNDLIQLNNRYKHCMNIIRGLKPIYQKQLPFLKEMAVVVKGKKRIATYLCELLNTATTTINAVVSPPHLLGEIVWQTVVNKMNNGIIYKRVTNFSELTRHGYAILKNEVTNFNEELYVHSSERLSQKFYVINNTTILFFIPDSKNIDFRFEAQIINNKGFADRYITIFNDSIKESYNLKMLLPNIKLFRTKFIEEAKTFLNDKELLWLINVFDYGVFSNHKEFPLDVYTSAKRKCIERNIVICDNENNTYVNYKLIDIINNGEGY